jgi:hypothetical protein
LNLTDGPPLHYGQVLWRSPAARLAQGEFGENYSDVILRLAATEQRRRKDSEGERDFPRSVRFTVARKACPLKMFHKPVDIIGVAPSSLSAANFKIG